MLRPTAVSVLLLDDARTLVESDSGERKSMDVSAVELGLADLGRQVHPQLIDNDQLPYLLLFFTSSTTMLKTRKKRA